MVAEIWASVISSFVALILYNISRYRGTGACVGLYPSEEILLIF